LAIRTGIKPVPTANITHQTLGSMIWLRKSAVYMKCDKKWLPFARQSRYHDHIVRDEQAYHNIEHYIRTNPDKRENDKFRREI
jgi:hypothetical protein